MNKYGKYRSLEELEFSYYLDELKDAGIIKSYKYEPRTYNLLESVPYTYQVELKTKTKDKSAELLKGWNYTPDFEIEWNTREAINIFVPSNKDNVKKFPFYFIDNCIVDVKGAAGNIHYSSYYTFPHIQKMMYHVHGIYVQKIQPMKLFEKTFTPKVILDNYIYVRGLKKGQSKLKFKGKTLNEYLNER